MGGKIGVFFFYPANCTSETLVFIDPSKPESAVPKQTSKKEHRYSGITSPSPEIEKSLSAAVTAISSLYLR